MSPSLVRRQPTAAEAAAIALLIRDPVDCAEHFLATSFWDMQRRILRALNEPYARVAVKGCHASGKTFMAARAVLWWLLRWPDAMIITTAPTWSSVRRLIWGEIRAAVREGLIQFPVPSETEIRLPDGSFAIGLSTTESERFQGFHGKHVLIVVDESPGVRAAIFEAIEGIRAGGDVRELALGNPTVPSGPFFDMFNQNREMWATFTIGAFDTPNLASVVGTFGKTAKDYTDEQLIAMLESLSHEELHQAPWPDLTTRRWVLEKWHEWGKHGNPLWDSRVMGRFPKQDPSALFFLLWLEEAQRRAVTMPRADEPLEAGIDVAGPGEDETVLYIRQGPNVLSVDAWNTPDPRGPVVAKLLPYQARNIIVRVDSIGIGYNFGLHLRDLGFRVVLVNVGKASRFPERFKLLKDELYWGLRERFEAGQIAGLSDEKTVAQMTTIRWKPDPRGLIRIESKEDMAERQIPSPDRAEALMLAFAPIMPAEVAFA